MISPATKQLLDAAWDGDLEKVKEALRTGADVNAMEEYGSPALHKAAGQGHYEVVEFLVANGADIELKDKVDMAAVMSAATAGQVKIMKFLISKGAKINYDLLSTVNMKVNILEENAEAGMVRPEAVEAWKGFLDYLVTVYKEQNPEG
jgi:ankyrin repeat protein